MHQTAHRRRHLDLTVLDVMGGIGFLFAAALAVFTIYYRISPGGLLGGTGWAAGIASKAPELMIVLLCAPLFRHGIKPLITWKTTLEGIMLDWPELILATITLNQFVSYFGLPHGVLWPTLMTLAVGIGEEFLFRVLLLGWLVTKLDIPRALVVSSIVFGIAHLHELTIVGLMNVTPQFCGGMVLGAIYLRTRNPIGPILCHAFWDLPYFLTMGAGISGGGTEGGMIPMQLTLMGAGLFTYGLFLVRERVGDKSLRIGVVGPLAARRY
jgi:membrane protease YdiL (CAAX protease family)